MPERLTSLPLPRPLAGAAACLALAGLVAPATAGAAAKPKPKPATQALHVQSVRVGGAAAPVVVRLRLPRTATLRASVNGRAAYGAFHREGAHERVGLLTAHDGLGQGSNRLRLRATLKNGRVLVATRSVRVTRPLADAGRDAVTVAGRGVEVGARGLMGSSGSRLRWTIASAPRGAKAKLADARSASPAADARPTRHLRAAADGRQRRLQLA